MKKRGRITHKLLALVGVLRGSGLTWEQVSKEVGYVNGPALYQRCRAYGMCKKYSKRPPLEKVVELVNKGHGRRQIAGKLKCSHGVIDSMCKENNLSTNGTAYYVSSGLAKENHKNKLKAMEVKSLGEIHALKYRALAVRTGWPMLSRPTPTVLRVLELLFDNPQGLRHKEIRSRLSLSLKRGNNRTYQFLNRLAKEMIVRCETRDGTGPPRVWFLTDDTRRQHCRHCRYRKIQYAAHLDAPGLSDSPGQESQLP